MPEGSIDGFLEQLGLTEYEAKTLSALFKLKEAQAPQVSRNAQVPKTRVYDVLDRLTKKDLIIEVSGRPKKYRVIEPSKVFDKLLEERKDEIKRLEQKAISFKKTVFDEQVNGGSEKVMKVKDKNDFLRILSQELAHTKKSLTVFARHTENYSLVSNAIKKLSEKNVDIKMISGAPRATEILGTGLDLKQADHELDAYIMDNKKVVLALSNMSEQKPEYHFIIWPENTHMANALQHYFEKLWQSAKKI